MGARWSELTRYLLAVDTQRVDLSWGELKALVGELPASAQNHQAWWSGDRAHVRAWTSAGFRVEARSPGVSVTFARRDLARGKQALPVAAVGERSRMEAQPTLREPAVGGKPDILLVTCVKTKASVPSAAKDLYLSPLFLKERAYAERLGAPWFILSAEFGLVAPDEWLAPYERYLPDTPPAYRTAWGSWSVERLSLMCGGLGGRVVEVHASAEYLEAIRTPLQQKGAMVVEPLRGLGFGQRLAWYDADRELPLTAQDAVAGLKDCRIEPSADHFVHLLTDRSATVTTAEFLRLDRRNLNAPGMYSWWVDPSGALELSAGLGETVEPGLIYAGLAGATRWPSGKASRNTLWTRIARMHLGKKHGFSTFRRTLGSLLGEVRRWTSIDEEALTRWMRDHLRVAAYACEDADDLGRLEASVLQVIDPPLNLSGMPPTPIRIRLTELRRQYRGEH
jgi:hypothetical protein